MKEAADVSGAARPLVIRGAGLLTMDPALGEIACGDILVAGGRIAAIGPGLDVPAGAQVIDADAMIAIPGFVDGHRHLWEGLIRNSLPIETLPDYLRIVNGNLAKRYTPEDAYLGTLVSALGLLECGITTVLDWSHVQTTREHTHAVILALRHAGVRAIFAYGPPGDQEAGHEWPHGLARLRAEEFSSDDDLLSLALATLSPEHVPYEVARSHFELARSLGVMVTAHAGLSGMGDAGQIERLGRDGLLGPDVNLVHCNVLSGTEWRMIADQGVSVSITPSTEMQMGQGVPPIQECLDYGVEPNIGVDVETSAPNDLWTQMRLLLALQRNNAFVVRDKNLPAPALISPAQILDCATAAGARSLGLGSRTGSLTVGKAADIVLLRADLLNVVPVNDMTSAVVLNMDARNVDTVLVAGELRKLNGRLLGHDVGRLTRRIYERRDAIFGAAQLPLASSHHRLQAFANT